MAQRALVLALCAAMLHGLPRARAQGRAPPGGVQQTKTRNLKGPASQPWKCKPVKIRGNWHGHHLHDKTFVNWECENTEVVQQVYEMTVHTRPSSEVYDNINNVFGRAKSMSTTGTVTFLGKFDKLDQCELACFKYSSGGAKCTGYTWHRLDFGDPRWARQCFAVLDGSWSPVRQNGAVSGKVIRDSNKMQDASGRGCLGSCSGHGVCQNTTGVCICDVGFVGIDCGVELGCDSPAVEGRCYSVFQRKTSWQKAFDRCAKSGGALAVVSSQLQQTVLSSVLGNCQRTWIGLSDHEEEGHWVWADGYTRSSFRNWDAGEPNNKGNEDYVVIKSASKQYRWSDAQGRTGNADCYACSYREGATSAHSHHPAACARDCSGHGSCGAATGTCTCVEGYFGPDCGKKSPCEGKVLGDKCYAVYAEKGDRRAGELKCRARGGQLSGVESQEIELALLQLAEDEGCRHQEMWIGLNDQEREGFWEWADRDSSDADYFNWQPWEPNNGAEVPGGTTQREEDGVILDKYGWVDAEVTRANVSCFSCEFDGAGLQEPVSALGRMGEAVVEVPVLFNFFAADQDPVLRRVACVPGSGSCVDQEGYGGMEPVVCGRALETGERDGGEENDEELWEEVPEGEEGWEEDEEGDDDGDDVSGDTMPPAATIEVPAGMCRAPLDLMQATAERCWRSCADVMERFGEDASDSCRQSCFRMAGQINEDMALVADGEGGDVVEYYGSVNISDPSKVGTQGSDAEKLVRTDALVNNVWAAAVLVGQMDAAESKLIQLIKAHPYLYQLHYTLAVGLLSQGRLQEAKAEFRRCVEPPSQQMAASKRMRRSDRLLVLPHCRAGLASVLLRQGHVEEALEVLVLAVEEDAWFAPLHSALASVRLQRAEPVLALTHALEAVDLRADVVHFRMQAALAARQAGRLDQAQAVLMHGLQLLQENDETQAPLIHLVLAELAQHRIAVAREGRAGGFRRFRAQLCTDRCVWQDQGGHLYGGEQTGSRLVLGIPIFGRAARDTLWHYRLAARALRKRRLVFDRCQRRVLRGDGHGDGDEDEDGNEEDMPMSDGIKDDMLSTDSPLATKPENMSQQEWQRRVASHNSKNSARQKQVSAASARRAKAPQPPRHPRPVSATPGPASGAQAQGPAICIGNAIFSCYLHGRYPRPPVGADRTGVDSFVTAAVQQELVAAEKHPTATPLTAGEKQEVRRIVDVELARRVPKGWLEYFAAVNTSSGMVIDDKLCKPGRDQLEEMLMGYVGPKGERFWRNGTLQGVSIAAFYHHATVATSLWDRPEGWGVKKEYSPAEVRAALLKCGKAPPATELLRVRAAMAHVLATLGAWEEAAEVHDALLRVRPGHVPSLVGKAAAAAALGKYSTAGESIELAKANGFDLRVAASEIKVAYGTALMELARSMIKDKQFKQSLPMLRASLKIDSSRTMPYAVDAWRLLCRSYAKQNKPESALFACTNAQQLAADLSDVVDNLAWAKQEVKLLVQFREGRARQEKQARDREAREKARQKEKENDEWKWEGGDGEWHKGRGGGRGNKQGQRGSSKVKTAPRGLYDILELKPSCKKADIKRAYHRLSLKFHPDKNPDKKDTPNVDENKVAAEKFREIAVAYQELLLRHVDGAADDDAHCINC